MNDVNGVLTSTNRVRVQTIVALATRGALTTLINATIDPLLDDGKMLEDALRSANVSVERRVYDGSAHEFFGMAAVVLKSMEAQQDAGERLKAAFGR